MVELAAQAEFDGPVSSGDMSTLASVFVADVSTTTALLIALAGGGIGTVLAAMLAYSGWVSRIRREIAANDRELRVGDDHLETWVADDTVRLQRELRAVRDQLSKDSMFHSGEYAHRIVPAKERALQAYRDQERTSLSKAAGIRGREGRLHALVRAWRGQPAELRAPARVKPVLDGWAVAPTRHGGPNAPIDDPRTRTIEGALRSIANDPMD